MVYDRDKPLIVQKDMTVLFDVRHPDAVRIRDELSRFADLVKSPEPFHTYRISSLSLWNAAAAGTDCETVIRFLAENGRTDLPDEVAREIGKIMRRYGLIRLEAHEDRLRLVVDAGEPLRAGTVAAARGVLPGTPRVAYLCGPPERPGIAEAGTVASRVPGH